jgi:hypothetical protein
MEPLLRSDDNRLDSRDNRYFEALANEARTEWGQIVKDANVAELITALKAADDVFADDAKFVDNYLSLRQNASRFKPAAAEVVDGFRGTKQLKKFDIFAKAYHLRSTWKLDPVLMHELNGIYGPSDVSDPNKHFPLDWRHPDSHAIYWAVKGLREVTKEQDREIDITETNTDRLVGHGLQNLFRYGKIFIYDALVETPEGSSSQPAARTVKRIFLRPDLRMFRPYNQAMLAVLAKYKELDSGGSYTSLQDGHRNMLKNATFLFYQAGHKPQAREIYRQLRKLYPIKVSEVSLDQFATNRFREEIESIGIFDAKEQILALLREAYFRYALRDDDEAFGREKLAEQVYDYYQKKYDPENRIDLPKFPQLRYAALFDVINDAWYPLNLRQSLLNRIQIERPELYEELQQEEQIVKQEMQESG